MGKYLHIPPVSNPYSSTIDKNDNGDDSDDDNNTTMTTPPPVVAMVGDSDISRWPKSLHPYFPSERGGDDDNPFAPFHSPIVVARSGALLGDVLSQLRSALREARSFF